MTQEPLTNISAVEVQQRLESWRWGAQWPAVEVDYEQLRAIIGVDPLITIQEVPKEFNINHSMVIQHLKPFYGHFANSKVEKTWWVGASWADQKSKKSLFWSVFSYYMQQQQNFSWLDCDV